MLKARQKIRVGQRLIIHDDEPLRPGDPMDFEAEVIDVSPGMIKWSATTSEKRGGFSRFHDQENVYLTRE